MNKFNLKRLLSLFLAMVMVFTMVPTPAHAEGEPDPTEEVQIQETEESTEETADPTEESSEPSEEASEPSEEEISDPAEETEDEEAEPVEEGPSAPSEPEVEENPYIAQFQAEMDRILETYLGSADVAPEDVPTLASQLDEYALSDAAFEILILLEDMLFALDDGDITEAEGEALVEANPAIVAFSDYTADYLPDLTEYKNGTYTPTTGVTVAVSGSGGGITGSTNDSMSNGAITVTAKSASVVFGMGGDPSSVTITVTNGSGSTATVSFDWTATSVNDLKIDGTKYSTTSGSFSKVLDTGSNFQVTIATAAKNTTENKLVMRNFAVEPIAESSKVTFLHNTLGSITVAGETVSSGDLKEISKDGATLVATPVSGATFIGWIDTAEKTVLSASASYTFQPASDMTVEAVFTTASSNAWFLVDSTYLLNDLATAVTKGTSVVLAANGTLPAGDYTIPSGVTLLIPYDSANTLRTTSPGMYDNSYTAPSVYRTMTMADGASITVNGAISVAGSQSSQYSYNGQVSGPYGKIQMNDGSSITINNGANLYCWGYITGSGTVTVESGGTVYEDFQIKDYRGGDMTNEMQNNSQRVFPMSQFYIQNVEVPMTMKAGAMEKGYMSVSITLVGTQTATVPFIGSDGLFNITSGNLVKDYDETTDRLVIDINGDISVKPYTFSIKVSTFGTVTLATQKYTLGLNNNMYVRINSGVTTVTQDLALLPGVILEIGSNGKMVLDQSAKLFVYDYTEWTNAYNEKYSCQAHFVYPDGHFLPLSYVGCKNGKPVSRSIDDAVLRINGILDATAGYVYTTESGADICSTGGGKLIIGQVGSDKAYQVDEGRDSSNDLYITYFEIPVTPAKLQNGDNSNPVQTEAGTFNYKAEHGKWVKDAHTLDEGKVTQEATCTENGIKTFTCTCGYSYQETIPAQHDFTGEWQKDGQNHWKKCSRCDATDLTTEHGYDAVVTPPTCEADGYTTHTCATCGNSYTDSTVISSGHNYLTEVTNPTCTEKGYTTYTCDNCGDTYTANETEKIPHSMTPHAAVTATCQKEGNVEYWACSSCDKNYSDEAGTAVLETVVTTVNPNNHTGTASWTKSADKHSKAYNCCDAVVVAEENHEWSEGKCSECGYECEHSYQSEVTPPTCASGGYTTHTCTGCGDSYTEEIEKLTTHTPAEAVVENRVESTCTAEGSYENVVYCTVCNAELSRDTVTVDKIAHAYNAVVTAPTCTKKGYTTYTCTACGDSYVADETEMVAHTPAAAVEENRVESTCTVAGSYDSVVYCSACNTELSREAKALELAAHTEGEAVVENKVDATCTAEGSYENVVYCTVCNAELSRDTVTVDKIAHAYNAVVTAPTCTAKGYTTYTCTACGDSYVADETEMVAHTPAAAVEENRVESTCTVAGSYESVVYCSACKTELSRDTVTVEKASHAYNTVVTAPTCTAKGYTTYTCSACGNSYEADPVEATGHSYERNYTGPTFEADGFTTYTCHCGDTYTVTDEGTQLTAVAQIDDKKFQTLAEAFEAAKDDEEENIIELLVKYTIEKDRKETWNLDNDTLVIPNIDGNYGIVVKGSLTVQGGTFVVKGRYGIGVTGELLIQDGTFTYDKEGEKPATDYLIGNWGETAIEGGTFQGQYNCVNNFADEENYPDATVTITGGTFRTEEFDFSGKYLSFDVLGDSGVEISGGSFSKDVNDHAAEGYCAQKIDGLYVVAEHNYTSVVTEPTCTAGGYTTYTCSRCSASYTSDEVAHLGHNWQDATCTAPKTCSVCQATEGDKLAHSFTEEVSRIAATCNENGSVTRKCATCTETEVEVLTIDPNNHDIVRYEAQAPTCTAIGWDAYETCSRCDYTTYAEKAALGHNEVPHEAQAPTCTAIGWDAYETCSRCDYTTYVEKEALDHAEVSHEAKAPTCTDIGWDAYVTCSRCDYTTYVEKAALGHNLQDVAGKASTCTEDGYTAYKDCSRCDYTEGKAVVPATGHVNTTTTTVDATCTTDGSVTVTCACGHTVSTTVIPAKNHIPAEAVRENEKAATCGADGSYDSVVYCSVETCKAQISRETVTVPANGNHDWQEANYEAPETCSVCKATRGEKVDRPAVEVVEPEDVTSEKADDTVTDEDAQEVVNSVVNASGQVEQPKDTGIAAEDNKAALENAAGSNRYDTSLVITVNSVVVAKDGDSAVAKSVTYEVSPMLYVLDETGTQTDAKKIEKFESPITFHLPVDNNTRAIKAQVWHEQTLLGSFEIREDSSGNKFVEVTSATFSKFTVAPVTECTDHEYVDGVCKHCGAEEPKKLFDFYGTSVNMGNNLDMQFAFPMSGAEDWTDHYVRMSRSYADGSVVTKDIPYSEWTVNGSYYVVTYAGFAAKEMCDEVTLVVYNSQGQAVSNPWTDSMRSYAMRMFDKSTSSDKLKTVFVDMLNYGAAAQQHFGYDTENLANRYFEARHLAYASSIGALADNLEKGSGWFGSSIVLKSNIQYQIAYGDITDDMYAVVKFTGHKGNEESITIQGSEMPLNGSFRIIELNNMVVADARCEIEITIYKANGEVFSHGYESMEAYAARNAEKYPIVKAFMIFADSAHAYLHRNDQ